MLLPSRVITISNFYSKKLYSNSNNNNNKTMENSNTHRNCNVYSTRCCFNRGGLREKQWNELKLLNCFVLLNV